MNDDTRQPDPGLRAPDAEAVDRFLGNDRRLALAGHDARHELLVRLGDALARVDLDEAGRAALVERVLDETRHSPRWADTASLETISDEAVEALVMRGYDPSRVPSALATHSSVAAFLLRQVGSTDEPTERWLSNGRGRRVDTVMRSIAASGESAPIPMERPMPRRRLPRLADLATVAAMLLVGVTLVSPLFGTLRGVQRQTACLANLGSVSTAFGQYAGDHRDALPAATDRWGTSYMRVGTRPEDSNSANLFTLARTGYAPLADLACPGNEHAFKGSAMPGATDWADFRQVSYSYRLLGTPGATLWAARGPGVLMADRSPVMLAIARSRSFDPDANSPQHGGTGQHVLTLSGAVSWMESPVMGDGDNIWIPSPIELAIDQARRRVGLLTGEPAELRSSLQDTFLGP